MTGVLVALSAAGPSATPPALAQSPSADLTAVACPSANLCFAVGAAGVVLRYDGSAWTPALDTAAADLFDVGCDGVTRCFAVGAGGTILGYDGASWSAPSSPTTNDLYGVGCAEGRLCFAAGAGGALLRFDANGWTALASVTDADLYDAGCRDTSLCFAVGDRGTILMHGDPWKALPPLTANALYGVTCPLNCLGVGADDTLVEEHNGAWSAVSSGTTASLSGVA